MKREWIPLFVGLIAQSAWANAAPTSPKQLFDLWGRIRTPLPGKQEPIGTYAAGCIAGAEKLPLDGIGYSVMRPSRQRYYGHHDLVEFIQNLGRKMQANHLPRLLVGDLGRPRGGPMLSGHSSHQIGLDVDLWFRMSRRRPSQRERETWNSEPLVRKDSALSSRWSDSQRKLLALAADSPLVERIFVHPAIKRDLCARFAGEPWLYKFRAWWGHDEHLHVRLHCPAGSACQPQTPLDPKDTQCGAELAWWLSDEAKEEGRKKSAAFGERPFPSLPEQCSQMTSEMQALETHKP